MELKYSVQKRILYFFHEVKLLITIKVGKGLVTYTRSCDKVEFECKSPFEYTLEVTQEELESKIDAMCTVLEYYEDKTAKTCIKFTYEIFPRTRLLLPFIDFIWAEQLVETPVHYHNIREILREILEMEEAVMGVRGKTTLLYDTFIKSPSYSTL